MLTIREAQELTGVSEKTIRTYIVSGIIKSQIQNRKYMIEESELSKLPKPRNGASKQTNQKEQAPDWGTVIQNAAETGFKQGAIYVAELLGGEIKMLDAAVTTLRKLKGETPETANFHQPPVLSIN